MDTSTIDATLRRAAEKLRALADEIETGTTGEEVGPEWRPDGFSTAVSTHGGRRHVKVDAALEQLASQDVFGREVAQQAARVFAFDLELFPELDPGTEELRNVNRGARNNVRGIVMVGSLPSEALPFRLTLPLAMQDPAEGRYFEYIDGHAFVHIKHGDTPAAFCARYAQRLIQLAEERRAAAREADEGVVRPDQDTPG